MLLSLLIFFALSISLSLSYLGIVGHHDINIWVCSASPPRKDTRLCYHCQTSADYITIHSIDPIKLFPVIQTLSFFSFLVQNLVQEHILHLIILSHQCASIWNSCSVFASLLQQRILDSCWGGPSFPVRHYSLSWTQDTYPWQGASLTASGTLGAQLSS